MAGPENQNSISSIPRQDPPLPSSTHGSKKQKRKIKKKEEKESRREMQRLIAEQKKIQKAQEKKDRKRLKAEQDERRKREELEGKLKMMAEQRKKVESEQQLEMARLMQEQAEKLVKLDESFARAHQMYEKMFGKRPGGELDDEERPKKIPKADNPFASPISSYDASLLLVNNPFIELGQHDIQNMPSDNVLDGKVMDKEALSETMRVLMRPVVKGVSQYKGTKTELGARIIHASLLENLKLLTLPALNPEVWIASKFGDFGESDVEWLSDDIRHEGDEGDSPVDFDQFYKRTDRYDFKGMVLDKKSNTKVAVLIVECDYHGEEKKLFQASGYGIRAAIRNAKKGYFHPIYLHNWGVKVWRYGVLRPLALVEIKCGEVVEVTTKTGLVSKRSISGRDKAKENTQTEASGSSSSSGSDILIELDQKLTQKTELLCEEYVLMKNYPDGVYIDGRIDLNTTQMDFPALGAGSSEENMIRFVNSLMRTFVGDSVLEYTKDDVKKIVAARRSDLDEEIERRHYPFSRAYDNFTKRGPRFLFGISM